LTQVEATMEASLAPHEGDLLSLPFDQYGRMRIAQNCLHVLYTEIARQVGAAPQSPEGSTNGSAGTDGLPTGPAPTRSEPYRLKLLDIGGYPGVLRHFLDPQYFDVHVLDVVPDDGSIPNYTQGSGMRLPFGDGSFEVVTALDTLEHIPHAERDLFLSELMRVGRCGALLINPIQSVEADVAEETLNEYIKWVLDAQQEQLKEHRDFGLPNFTHTVHRFTEAGWGAVTFTTANVHNWLLMMIAKHYLISMRDDSAAAFERTLDRFYNLTFSDSDMADPAYRGVVVAVRPGLDAALHNLRAKYPPPSLSESANALRIGLTQTLMQMLNLKQSNHEDRKLREQIERRDTHIAALEQKVAVLDLQLDQARAELRSTHDTVETQREEIEAQRGHGRNLETVLSQTRDAYAQEFDRQASYIGRLEKDLAGKDEHIHYLEQLLQGIEAGRVMRITRAFTRFLGR
jgi:hypothetical protein